MLLAAAAAGNPRSPVPDIFLSAIRECVVHVYRPRINLRHYAVCILDNIRRLPGCTSARGMATIPEVQSGVLYQKPGYTSPLGRVYVREVVLAEEHVAEGLGEVKIIVIINAPILRY